MIRLLGGDLGRPAGGTLPVHRLPRLCHMPSVVTNEDHGYQQLQKFPQTENLVSFLNVVLMTQKQFLFRCVDVTHSEQAVTSKSVGEHS